jgi:hypothetical protein
LATLYLLFWRWHSPARNKLTDAEIAEYMARIEKLSVPTEEAKASFSRIRSWAEADDGKPVYMFNLIHHFPELHKFAGAPEFKGTPREANAYYERSLARRWLSHAAYPTLKGTAQGDSLIDIQPGRNWDEMIVVRYRNRRTFLKLVSDPSYAVVEPYKFMAVELDLVPVSGESVVPDLRWVLGAGLLTLFLALGWTRAARLR